MRLIYNPWCRVARFMYHRVGSGKQRGFRLFHGVWILYGKREPLL